MNRKQTGFNLAYVLIAVLGVLILQDFFIRRQAVVTIPYSEFQKLVREDKISSVVVGQDQISGEFKEPIEGKKRFVALRVDADIVKELDQHGVEYRGQAESNFLTLLSAWVLPIALFVAIYFFVGRRMARQLGGPGGGLMAIGKSKARVYVETDIKVTFADVAGVDEAKAELQEVVSFLKDPKQHGRLGARMPKGVLLVGPPGTGKTLLAKAVAGEAAVPFFSISGSEFVEMFVGVGAARVRDLFEQARAKAPCIIFIDELDALGRARGAIPGFGGHDEKEQTLNQLLVEMDGFESNDGVILIAATNRPDVLDPALLRPGRFDRQIVVDVPDVRGREGILRVHTRNIPVGEDVNLNTIARGTPGMVGADLANLVNEAALLAARRNHKRVSAPDFEDAKDKVMMGTERRSLVISDTEKKSTSYHEAGHALMAWLQPGSDKVHKVTIIPRGRALGLTAYLPTDERHSFSREYWLRVLTHLMGGRAAELIVLNQLTTGASDDIRRATNIARRMVCEWGMSERLGPLTFGSKEEFVFLGREISQSRDYSEKTAIAIDEEVRNLVDGAYNHARQLLNDNLDKLHLLALALLEREMLDGEEVEKVLRGEKLEPLPRRSPTDGQDQSGAAQPVEEDKERPERAPRIRTSESPGIA